MLARNKVGAICRGIMSRTVQIAFHKCNLYGRKPTATIEDLSTIRAVVRLEIDGKPVEAQAGSSLLVAMLRAGLHPTGGGCLCAGGDCPHCLVTVDGVAYTRSCQVKAEAGMAVRRDHLGGKAPPLPASEPRQPPPAHHIHCDTVVIGQGASGREAARDARDAGLRVVTLDAREGQQVTGVYPGPLVVARGAGQVLHVHPRREIVVATGAAENQPVVPGSSLKGLLTARAAADLQVAGIPLGRAVALGDPPAGLAEGSLTRYVPLGQGGWELLRFEGTDRVQAVIVRGPAGPYAREEWIACDTAVLGLGRNPRDALARMASDLPVRVVGSAAAAPELPPCPREGTVCPCSGVTVADLDDVWKRGFREMELLKRATLAGTGACQGGVCLPYLRSFLLERGGRLQPAFTARPLNRQLTVRELAAGAHTAVTARSPLHDEHRRLGARMDRAGGWWRPWTCRRPDEEYAAVRERVSLGDVSPLGKFVVAGPDAEAFLERIVTTRVGAIRPGHCRYVLMLDERGYVLDDGMLCREEAPDTCAADTERAGPDSGPSAAPGGGNRFFLTSTSGGANFFELWLRDWAEASGFDVRILNRTASLAAINVTGPQAARLLARAGVRELPAFGRHHRLRVAGIDCRGVRLSFTGESSYELHHAADDAVTLWRRLLEAGAGFDVMPHGLKTLLRLRTEKGHIVVRQDTDYDSTPRRLGHEWAVDMEKGDFIGRQAILRTNRQPLDKRLVLLGDGRRSEAGDLDLSSAEGSAIFDGDRHAGYVTSDAGPLPAPAAAESSDSLPGPASATDGGAMLGWLYLDEEGNLPREVTVDGRSARRVDRPLYDPDGERARVAVDLATEPPEEVRNFPAERPEATDMAGETPSGPQRLRRLEATRVVAAPAALDALTADAPWRGDALALRIAADELLVTAPADFDVPGDPHAIVERETGFSGVWLDAADAERFLDRECDWERHAARPALAQGEVAGIPVKLWFEPGRTLLLAPAPFAGALQRRLSRALDHDAEGGP